MTSLFLIFLWTLYFFMAKGVTGLGYSTDHCYEKNRPIPSR